MTGMGEGPGVRASSAEPGDTEMPAIAEYLELLERRRALLLDTVAGLPNDALAWTPLPEASSSIAMLARHCADDLRWWLLEELAGQPVGYDRARAFAATGGSSATLAAEINAAFDQCAAALRGLDPALLDRVWPVGIAHPRRGRPQSGHFRLYYPLMHLMEHAGQMRLTRQLWLAAQGGRSSGN